MITITLDDGSVLKPVEKRGDCYIFDEVPRITGNGTTYTINEDGEETILRNAQFTSTTSEDGRPWFAFTEIGDKNKISGLRSDVDYIAMETGIDIE